MIRDAEYNDFDELLTFVKNVPAFQENVFNNYDESKIRRTFTICIASGYAKVVEHKGEIVGCMFGVIQENYWGATLAFDILNYSKYQTPQLLRLFSQWAKDNGASQVIIGNSFGSDRFTRLIEKLGFVKDTNVFTRRF